jgi:hypothetical protein
MQRNNQSKECTWNPEIGRIAHARTATQYSNTFSFSLDSHGDRKDEKVLNLYY